MFLKTVHSRDEKEKHLSMKFCLPFANGNPTGFQQLILLACTCLSRLTWETHTVALETPLGRN